MLNLLIFCNEIVTAKKLLNNIAGNLENTRVIGISDDLLEANTLIIKYQPELIITTNEMIFSLLKEKFISYYPKIILLTKFKKREYSYKNLMVLEKNSKFVDISFKINTMMIQNTLISKKEKTINILSQLGFDFKLSGTNYLLDSILYVHSYRGAHSFDNIYKDVYSHIAKIHNTNPDIIKWAITRSVTYMYAKSNKEIFLKIENYFGVKYPDKITPKLIINFIANSLDIL